MNTSFSGASCVKMTDEQEKKENWGAIMRDPRTKKVSRRRAVRCAASYRYSALSATVGNFL